MYILDTNVISAVCRPDRAPQVARWLAGRPEASLFLSVITIGEIARDPAFAADLRAWLDHTTRQFSDRILPFGTEDTRIWAG